VDPSQLDKSVISRIPFRRNRDTRYFTDRYQGNPQGGFTQMCRRMLDHPQIKVLLNTDYKEVIGDIEYGAPTSMGEIGVMLAYYAFDTFLYGPVAYLVMRFTVKKQNRKDPTE